jgi:hypothetical protein
MSLSKLGELVVEVETTMEPEQVVEVEVELTPEIRLPLFRGIFIHIV